MKSMDFNYNDEVLVTVDGKNQKAYVAITYEGTPDTITLRLKDGYCHHVRVSDIVKVIKKDPKARSAQWGKCNILD